MDLRLLPCVLDLIHCQGCNELLWPHRSARTSAVVHFAVSRLMEPDRSRGTSLLRPGYVLQLRSSPSFIVLTSSSTSIGIATLDVRTLLQCQSEPHERSVSSAHTFSVVFASTHRRFFAAPSTFSRQYWIPSDPQQSMCPSSPQSSHSLFRSLYAFLTSSV